MGSLRAERATLVFYEAPPRLHATLGDLVAAFGEGRPACLARELTKLHEEIVRGSLGELCVRYEGAPPLGECTLVVAGATEEDARAAASLDVEAEVRALLGEGATPREIAARLAVKTGVPRRKLYQLALALVREG